MTTPMTPSEHSLSTDLNALKTRYREINSLRVASSLMYWDQATYLPEKGAEARGEHLAHIDKLAHEMSTSAEIGHRLERLHKKIGELPPDSDDACLILRAREDFERDTKIPADFLGEFSVHVSRTYEAWKKARAAEDFSLVGPLLEKTVEMSRRTAEYIKTPAHQSIIDPLIDSSDPGFSVGTIRPLFSELRSHLVPLLEKITSQELFSNACLRQNFPEAKQLAFGEKVIRSLGYDFERGRQDKTTHPFMIRFAHSDVRITTRTKPDDLSEALFSTIHEAGHALYELGVAEQLDGTPLGHGASAGIHESQSRLWENLVARGLPFWEHFYPQLQAVFPEQLASVPLMTFYRAINRVEKSLIRTDADEVSYNLHVMIRFDLECDLLEGRLQVRDLPEAWNERYRSDLGITPKNLSEGVLQDVHWYGGRVGGSFQSYTIGNVLSAQLFAAAQRALPALDDEIRSGEFSALREWLRVHLHQHGRKFLGPDLIARATGGPLHTKDYLSYLDKKFSTLLG